MLLFYRNTRLLILTILLIVAWGISSLQLLPRLEDPPLTSRYGYISTHFPGASAERVESLITERLEQALQEIEDIDLLESTTLPGNSSIYVQLDQSLESEAVKRVWSQVRDRISSTSNDLPGGASSPELIEFESGAFSLIMALDWELDSNPNYAILRRFAKELEGEFRVLSGTEDVELFGFPSEEIIVEVTANQLSNLDLTPSELAQQIQASDAKVTAGRLRNQNDLLLAVDNELESLEQIREIPIRSGDASQVKRLGDISSLEKGIAEPPGDIALTDGNVAVVLAIRSDVNSRIDVWTSNALKTVEQFRQRLPEGVGLDIIFNQSQYVTSRLNTLFANLALGVVFVFASTVVLMGWRAASIIGLALPLSVLMVLGGMRLLQIPLHQMSLTGLVIALGLLIDNAIVMVDEMQVHLKAGLMAKQAIVRSVRQLSIPLMASTTTTVLAFMPIAIMPGDTGEFISSLGISVILALVSSLLISLTLIPALVARFHSGKKDDAYYQRWWNSGIYVPALTTVYKAMLKAVFKAPILGIVLTLLIPMFGFIHFSTLEEQFFPPAAREQIQLDLELSPQTALNVTQETALEVRDLLLKNPSIANIHWFVGDIAPAFYYNLPKVRQNTAYAAQALIELKTAKNSDLLVRQLQDQLDQHFPQARILVRLLEQGPYVEAPVEIRLFGPDLATLQELGNQLRAELTQVTNVIHTKADLSGIQPKLAFQIDEEKGQLVGLSNTSIAQQLNTTLEGVVGGSVVEDTEELPIRVRVSNQNRGDFEWINSLELLSDTSDSQVPISAVSEVTVVPETSAILRRNTLRVNSIQAFVKAGVLPSTILKEFRERLAQSDFQLPAGYSLEIGGEAAERDEAVAGLISTAGLLGILMVATLVLSFNSFRLAGVIGIVAIASVGLSLATLSIFGYPFGFMAIVGTVGLVGVAINDSIVILASLRAHPQAAIGQRRAVLEVSVHSTRHILTTTVTTIAGFIPLLLGGGNFWPPLAICIAGGVGGATLLALVFVPCVYLLLFGRHKWRHQ